MSFFHQMTFPRWVIVSTALASAVLGWFVYEKDSRLSEIELELARAPGVVREIQQLALQLNELQRLRDKDGFTSGEDPESYIRGIANRSNVQVGQTDINPNRQQIRKGIYDEQFTIEPHDDSRGFSRDRISNFMYTLEADSPRVKVTRFEISPHDKRKPGEVGRDEWQYEIQISTRVLEDT